MTGSGQEAGGGMLEAAAAAIAGRLVTLSCSNGGISAAPPAAGVDLAALGLSGLGLGDEPAGGGAAGGASGAAAATAALTAEDHQVLLGVERVRVPELLLQPTALAGVQQAGLDEVVAGCLSRLRRHMADAVASGGVVLTGGNLLCPGALPRCGHDNAMMAAPAVARAALSRQEFGRATCRAAALS